MDGVLTKEQAERLAIVQLAAAAGHQRISIQHDRTVERPFGWVFFVAIDDCSPTANSQAKVPPAVIVNKYSEQIVASSIVHKPERLIERYEKLLAENQARSENWCLTVSVPFPWRRWWKGSVEQNANEAGFYEIRGKEREP